MTDFDELLEGVLQEVSNVAPLDGFETRVMHRVRASGETRRRWKQGFAAALVVSMAALVLVLWPRHSTVLRPASPVISAQVTSSGAPTPAQVPTQLNAVTFAVRPRGSERRRVGPAENDLPKLAVFPSPVRVSPEVAMLMEYTHRHPEEGEALLERPPAGETAIKPIKIEPVRIPEIETASLTP